MSNLFQTSIYLLLLFLTLKHISTQPLINDVTGLFVDRVTLCKFSPTRAYYNNTMGTTAITPLPLSYPYTWRNSLSQNISSGLSFHSFKMNAGNNYLSFTAQLQNVGLVGADIQLLAFGNSQWIVYMTFNIIIVTIDTYNLQLLPYTGSYNILNISNRNCGYWSTTKCGSTTTNCTNATNPNCINGKITTFIYCPIWIACWKEWESFSIPSAKYFFSNLPQYSIGCFLQWIKFNTVPPVTDQNFDVSCVIISNSSFIGVNFYSRGNLANSLNSFKINILIIDGPSYSPNIAYWIFKWNTTMPFSLNFYSPNIFPNPLTQYHCIYGYAGVSRAYSSNSFFILGQTGGNVTSFSASLDYHSLYVFCAVTCQYTMFVDYYNRTQNCQLCDSYLIYCRRCNSKTYCTNCYPVAALTLSHTCTLCRNVIALCRFCQNINISYVNCTACYVGKLVEGGCTTVAGCTVVSQAYITALYSYCVDCQPTQFQYNSINHTCICREGRLVGEYCTTVDGCIATAKINGVVTCLKCSEMNRFQLKGVTCVCMKYFQPFNHTCIQICGDGVKITQQCDDGNLIDGDGCDHNCKTQLYYQCASNSSGSSGSSGSSTCKFYGLNIKINLTQARKIQGQNTAVFKFSFDPILLRLSDIPIQNYFFFDCDNCSIELKKWKYSNGYAQLSVDYLNDMQDKQAYVNFTFDRYYINTKPIPLNFTIKGKGNRILYFKFTNQLKIICMTLFSISILAYIFIFFGSWSQKLIGAEFIYSLQIIYYSQFGVKNYPSYLSPLQFLGLVGLNMKSQLYSLVNFRFYKDYQVLDFSSDIIKADFLTVLAITLFMFICVIVLIVVVKKTKAKKIKILKLMQQNNTIYNNCLFPFLVSLTLPLLIISSTMFFKTNSSSQTDKPNVITSFLCFLTMSAYFLNFTLSLLRNIFQELDDFQLGFSIQGGNNKQYLIFFQIMLLLSYFCLFFWLSMGLPFCLESLIGLITIFMLWQLIRRPYKNLIDNLSINSNILIAWSFLIIVFLGNQKVFSINNNISSILVLVYTGLLAFTAIISLVRMIKSTIRAIKGIKSAVIKPQKPAKGPKRFYEIGQSKEEIRLGLLRNRISQEKQLKQKEKSLKIQLDNEIHKQQLSKDIDEQFLKHVNKHKQQFNNKKINRLFSERSINF